MLHSLIEIGCGCKSSYIQKKKKVETLKYGLKNIIADNEDKFDMIL